MLNLFMKNVEEDNIFDALIIGQNMMSTHPEDEAFFNAYFSFLLDLSGKEKDLVKSDELCAKASEALDAFVNHAVFSDEMPTKVKDYSSRLETAKDNLLSKKIEFNDSALALIERLINAARAATTQAEYEKCLGQIKKLDVALKLEALTEEQSKKYEELTRTSASLPEENASIIQSLDKKNYNLRALKVYKDVFDSFRSGSNQDINKLAQDFFSFDATKLLPETLVYYNYVYSFIFSKLNDDGKFAMTKTAIMSEKK